MTSNSDRINYTINVGNNTSDPIRAEFSATRSVEVLTTPNEYEAQIKSFRIETNNLLLFSLDPNRHKIAMNLAGGGVDSSFFQEAMSANPIYQPQQLLSYVNSKINSIMTSIRGVNPLFTGGVDSENPFLSWDANNQKFVLFVPDYTASFSLGFSFSPALNKLLNIDTIFLKNAFLSTNELNYFLIQDELTAVTSGSFTYYTYRSQGVPEGLSDIDSIVIQTSSIPVVPTLFGSTVDIENIILKVYKPSIVELFNEELIVNYSTDNYFSLNSHYPIKTMDIQFMIIRKGGSAEPMTLYPQNAFSAQLEFKRLNDY
tara:strand:+ start:4988 stop:5932 length:945 start_codon:yes stop_codon:yes gene_type:complete